MLQRQGLARPSTLPRCKHQQMAHHTLQQAPLNPPTVMFPSHSLSLLFCCCSPNRPNLASAAPDASKSTHSCLTFHVVPLQESAKGPPNTTAVTLHAQTTQPSTDLVPFMPLPTDLFCCSPNRPNLAAAAPDTSKSTKAWLGFPYCPADDISKWPTKHPSSSTTCPHAHTPQPQLSCLLFLPCCCYPVLHSAVQTDLTWPQQHPMPPSQPKPGSACRWTCQPQATDQHAPQQRRPQRQQQERQQQQQQQQQQRQQQQQGQEQQRGRRVAGSRPGVVEWWGRMGKCCRAATAARRRARPPGRRPSW